MSRLCPKRGLAARLVPAIIARGLLCGWIALVLSAVPGPGAARAESEDASAREPAEQILITATRSSRSRFGTPGAVRWIDGADIERRLQPLLLPDALVETPGVMVQKTGPGQGSPFLRGLTGYQTLLLIDGVRLNNSTQRSGPNQYWGTVDAFGVGALEVNLGPAGVLYGSDAVGGVVQAFTRTPRPAESDSIETHGRALYRYGTADRSSQGRLEASLTRGGALGMLLGVSGKTFGNLEAGRNVGVQRSTGFDEYDVDWKLLLQPHPDHEISLLYQHVTQEDAPRTHRTVFAEPFAGTTVGNELKRDLDQRRELVALQLRSTPEDSFLDRAHVGISWQRPDEKRVRVRSDGRRDVSNTTVDTIGTFAQLDSHTDWGDWIYGFDYYHDFVDSARRDYAADGSFVGKAIQGPVGDDAQYGLLGIYTQWSRLVLPTVEIILGGRFTYAFADADRVADPQTGLPISLDDDWTNFSASAKALWETTDWLHLYASASQGFRAPNLSDLTRFDTARSNEIQTPSTDLDPEEFVGFELGAKARSARTWGEIALFYTWIDDGLIRTPTGRTLDGEEEVQVRNVGDGYVTGLEAGGGVEVAPSWSLFANIAYLYGKQDTFPTSAPDKRREWIDRMMPLNGSGGVRWNTPNDRFWAELSARWFASQHKLSPRDQSDTQRVPPGGTPSWATLNLYGGANLDEHLSLGVALENLTDKTYRIHGSGVTAPGFGARLTAELRY